MIQRLLLVVALGGVALSLFAFTRTTQPDPQLIRLAVHATVFAQPTQTPQVIEVTRIVQVTRVVERARHRGHSIANCDAHGHQYIHAAGRDRSAPLDGEVQAAAFVAPAATIQTEIQPEPAAAPVGCLIDSGRQYASIPVSGGALDHPDAIHGDLNLAIRGYTPVDAAAELITINGPTDGDPPELPALFADGRIPTLTQTWRVHDWNWSCGDDGCQGSELSQVEVSLIGMQTTPGELIMPPSHASEIYPGGVKALVLYADETRVTLGYTREGGVANGYAVHIESLCVDPNLLSLYHANNSAGRANLPGVRSGEVIGVASGQEIAVAIRDRGAFADPRSRKDWWRGH